MNNLHKILTNLILYIMNAIYNTTTESIILPNGCKLLVHYFKNEYYISPMWDLSCDISNKGFTSLMYSSSIRGLCKNINLMIDNNVNFDLLKTITYNSIK